MTCRRARLIPAIVAVLASAGLMATVAHARPPAPLPEDEGCVVVNVEGHKAGALDCVNYALRATVRRTKREVAATTQLDASSPASAVGGFNAAATAQVIAAQRASRPSPPPVPPVLVRPR